jgi:hypothetical protein
VKRVRVVMTAQPRVGQAVLDASGRHAGYVTAVRAAPVGEDCLARWYVEADVQDDAVPAGLQCLGSVGAIN